MELWTIVPEKAWQALNDRGVLRATQRHTDQDYLQAYEWMSYQMITRLGQTDMSTHLPIWAWYQFQDVGHKRPDLRNAYHLPAGEVGYRLTFNAEDDQVLLSDFNTWHHVLNYMYLPASKSDHTHFLAEFGTDADVRYSWDNPPVKTVIKQVIQDSWTRIFDLDWHDAYINEPRESKQIQGCVEELQLDQVVSVDQFVAR